MNEYQQPWLTYSVPYQHHKRYLLDMCIAFFIVTIFGGGIGNILFLVVLSDLLFWWKLKLYDKNRHLFKDDDFS